ncbi:MAG: hypothetical protein COA88_12725 [Kordia sp.]|nr:MAG: hypothetical protein COA88_12725 [Kordia sp.]
MVWLSAKLRGQSFKLPYDFLAKSANIKKMKKNNLFIWLSFIMLIFLPFSINAQITDVDGNVYKIIQIGEQIWMGENINVSSFRNGVPIPQAKTKEEWDISGDTGSPAWCYYENNPINGLTLGKLYNWHAINDVRGFSPLGWHIPSDDEWTELTDTQGGIDKAGIKMKSMTMWMHYSNKREEGAFEALPGGFRLRGRFSNGGVKGVRTYWWSSTKTWFRSLSYNEEGVSRDYCSKRTGMSVRCVKDNAN